MKSFFHAVTLRLKIERDNEVWEYSEEPHVSRRQLILQKHPEIKQLMGYDPMIAVYVFIEVIIQFFMIWMIYVLDVNMWTLIILSYVVSGTINHSLGSAIHEIGHNLAFGHKNGSANRILSIFANLPMGVPMAISYKKYHQDHHRWLGHDSKDVDVPAKIESYMFNNCVTKLLWLFFFPIFHSIRPFFKSPKPVTHWEIVNFVVQGLFDLFILKVFGIKCLVYMVFGIVLGLGVHPLSGHFISEHFLFADNQATHSYYGPLNFLMYNLGYHVEHHDFPYIPCTKIHRVRQIAPEFYEHLPYHTSWCKVLFDFLWLKKMGPQAHSVTLQNKSHVDIYKNMAVISETSSSNNGNHAKCD